MAGYTPVFADIYMGTLYGRWPAAAVWASLLPLLDKNGRLDMSMQAISGMTGWPMDLLEEGIRQLMEPDENSRSPDDDGRRLVPIDPERAWGWQAVNHAKYREKARLQAKVSREVEDGKNAERMRDRRRPPETAADPPSNANTNTNAEKKKTGAIAPRPSVQEVAEYIRSRGSNVDAQRFVDFYTSNGWKVGKNPMKDWKAAVRTWEKRDEKPNGAFGKPVRIEDKLAHLRRLSGEETGGESLDPPRGDVRGAVLEGVFRRAE